MNFLLAGFSKVRNFFSSSRNQTLDGQNNRNTHPTTDDEQGSPAGGNGHLDSPRRNMAGGIATVGNALLANDARHALGGESTRSTAVDDLDETAGPSAPGPSFSRKRPSASAHSELVDATRPKRRNAEVPFDETDEPIDNFDDTMEVQMKEDDLSDEEIRELEVEVAEEEDEEHGKEREEEEEEVDEHQEEVEEVEQEEEGEDGQQNDGVDDKEEEEDEEEGEDPVVPVQPVQVAVINPRPRNATHRQLPFVSAHRLGQHGRVEFRIHFENGIEDWHQQHTVPTDLDPAILRYQNERRRTNFDGDRSNWVVTKIHDHRKTKSGTLWYYCSFAAPWNHPLWRGEVSYRDLPLNDLRKKYDQKRKVDA